MSSIDDHSDISILLPHEEKPCWGLALQVGSSDPQRQKKSKKSMALLRAVGKNRIPIWLGKNKVVGDLIPRPLDGDTEVLEQCSSLRREKWHCLLRKRISFENSKLRLAIGREILRLLTIQVLRKQQLTKAKLRLEVGRRISVNSDAGCHALNDGALGTRDAMSGCRSMSECTCRVSGVKCVEAVEAITQTPKL